MQCRCSHPAHAPVFPTHSGLGSQAVGHWVSLPDSQPISENSADPNCRCGCNRPEFEFNGGTDAPSDGLSPDIPDSPLELVWEASDDISDDSEYVSIKATDLADMLSDLRDCRCNASCKAPE